MRLTIAGCGDAFGSGGRLNTCFHVAARDETFLIDCGATALPGLKRLGIDRNAIATILVTHFHLDHVGGVPPFILDGQFFSGRTEPLTIAGPVGLKEFLPHLMDTAFIGSAAAKRKFEVELVELAPQERTRIGSLVVTPRIVRHGKPQHQYYSYRVECDGQVLAYSGDTEWTDALVDTGRGADLFIAEAYFHARSVPFHLDYATLAEHLPRVGAKRVLLTHMNEDMLAHADDVAEEAAHDGLVVDI